MTIRRATLALAAAFAAALILFLGWPGLDRAVSDAFHDPATGAWAGAAPLPEALREVFWKATELSVAVFATLFLLALLRRGRAEVPARVWGFGLAALALGPGLLVNGLLKAEWHRARPRTLAEFGGEAAFTPAWQIAGDCTRNCSFVSGEAAGTLTLALVLWLIAGRRTTGTTRAAVAAGLALSVLIVSGQRLAAGGHFLSDVVFAWLLSAGVTLVLWRLTGAARAAERLTPAALGRDLAAPVAALGRWFGRQRGK